jgi:hypothetical protein
MEGYNHTTKDRTNQSKKETTRSITFRLPTRLINNLESEAEQKNISLNVLVKQILEKYMEWDRFSDKIGMIPVPKKVLQSLDKNMNSKDINNMVNAIHPTIQDIVMFMKGDYDLLTCIETLESYMYASGVKSDHRVSKGGMHNFIIQHELGMNWSIFTEQLLKEIFHKFLPDKTLTCKITQSTIIATIELGSDFDV